MSSEKNIIELTEDVLKDQNLNDIKKAICSNNGFTKDRKEELLKIIEKYFVMNVYEIKYIQKLPYQNITKIEYMSAYNETDANFLFTETHSSFCNLKSITKVRN